VEVDRPSTTSCSTIERMSTKFVQGILMVTWLSVSIPTSADYPTIVLQESRTSFYIVAAAVMVFSYPEIKINL
jgi:hypothetical protein